jgi:hypothetical protein
MGPAGRTRARTGSSWAPQGGTTGGARRWCLLGTCAAVCWRVLPPPGPGPGLPVQPTGHGLSHAAHVAGLQVAQHGGHAQELCEYVHLQGQQGGAGVDASQPASSVAACWPLQGRAGQRRASLPAAQPDPRVGGWARDPGAACRFRRRPGVASQATCGTRRVRAAALEVPHAPGRVPGSGRQLVGTCSLLRSLGLARAAARRSSAAFCLRFRRACAGGRRQHVCRAPPQLGNTCRPAPVVQPGRPGCGPGPRRLWGVAAAGRTCWAAALASREPTLLSAGCPADEPSRAADRAPAPSRTSEDSVPEPVRSIRRSVRVLNADVASTMLFSRLKVWCIAALSAVPMLAGLRRKATLTGLDRRPPAQLDQAPRGRASNSSRCLRARLGARCGRAHAGAGGRSVGQGTPGCNAQFNAQRRPPDCGLVFGARLFPPQLP